MPVVGGSIIGGYTVLYSATSKAIQCVLYSVQYVTLKLERPVIVRSILFGKFDKSHPCNLRKFRVYGGMDLDHLHLLIEE